MSDKPEGLGAPPLAPQTIGDRVRDCDPRSSHRTGIIVRVFPYGYAIEWGTGTTIVLARRVHHDPQKKSGYVIISEQPRAAPSSPLADLPEKEK